MPPNLVRRLSRRSWDCLRKLDGLIGRERVAVVGDLLYVGKLALQVDVARMADAEDWTAEPWVTT